VRFPLVSGGFSPLSPAARAHILDPANDVYLSAVSAWEIARKFAQGRISLPSHPSTLIPAVREESGIASLQAFAPASHRSRVVRNLTNLTAETRRSD
jgi:PIN domain nuclease of toxin-antitoxin system